MVVNSFLAIFGTFDALQLACVISRPFWKGAPTLLETLLDGFIWRSRLSVHGMRRVNYYIKYLIQERRPGTEQYPPRDRSLRLVV